MSETFFDSNVPLYLVSLDLQKAQRAEQLISGGGTISVRVLNEVALTGRRKFAMPWSEIDDLLAGLRLNLAVTPLTLNTHDAGIRIAKAHGFRIYDALLLAAALQAGCTTFWSEDLHDGQLIDGQLTIRNPFA